MHGSRQQRLRYAPNRACARKLLVVLPAAAPNRGAIIEEQPY